MKFYTSVSKLKVRKFWWLILTFVEVTGKKMVKDPFWVMNELKFSTKKITVLLIQDYILVYVKMKVIAVL